MTSISVRLVVRGDGEDGVSMSAAGPITGDRLNRCRHADERETGFIGLQYRLAHRSLLDYLAGSAVLEVDPEVYAKAGDPYQFWETIYGVDPEVLAPVRQHTRDDVLGGHASLFRQVALDEAPEALPLETALSALASARVVFDATRLWQRDMYEHYQLSGGSPAKAAL
jgi:hypothetical protein